MNITFRGQIVEAEVYLSADTGLSKIFLLHVPLREYQLLLPVVWVNGEFVDMLHGEKVTIENLPATVRISEVFSPAL